jgi:hypothetical protein
VIGLRRFFRSVPAFFLLGGLVMVWRPVSPSTMLEAMGHCSCPLQSGTRMVAR